MPPRVVPYIGGTYRFADRDISSQDAVNIEPIRMSKAAKTDMIARRTEGISLFSDLSSIVPASRPIRAEMANSDGDLYTVVGDSLILVDNAGTPSKVMDITDGISPVSMAELNGSLFICDGTTIWGYKYSTGTKGVASLPFTKPVKIVAFGNRLLAINNDETIDPTIANFNKVYWSDVNNGYSWKALAWSEAEGRSDQIIGIEIVSGGILVQGKNSLETWNISSDPYKPFVRNSVVPYGGLYYWVNSTSTPTGTSYWVGSGNDFNNVIVRSSGGGFEIISNEALNAELGTYSTLKDCRSWSYVRDGQIYVVFTFLAENKTWVFNETQGEWHRRTSRDPLTNSQDYYTPLFSANAYDSVIVGSITGAYLMKLDKSVYTEWDHRFDVSEDNLKPILVEYVSPVYWSGKSYMIHNSFELDIDTGHAPLSGSGSNPKLMMRFSDDGGYTYSKERVKPIGKRGKYASRVRFKLLGGSTERIYKISFSDNAPLTILGAIVDAEKGGY